MFSSRLFWKLFLAGAGLNVVGALIVGSLVAGRADRTVWRETHERLHHAAGLAQERLVALVTAGEVAELQSYLAKLSKPTGWRYEVFDLEGNRLASSHPGEIEDEAQSMVLATAEHPLAPNTAMVRLLLTDRARAVGILGVSADVRSVRAEARAARRMVWLMAAIVAALLAGVGYVLVAHVVRSVTVVRQAVDAIAVGDYRQRVYLPPRDELGALARSFNRMSQELDARMTQLWQSGQRQTTILGGMIEGVIAVDDRQRVLFANTAAGRLFGFLPPAVEGRPLLEAVRVHALHEAVSTAIAHRRPHRLEAEINADEKLTLAIQATPLPGQPCPGVVLVLHDITELRRLERVRQEFVANVSHELKTPLSSIKAYAETLRNGALNDPKTSHRFAAQIEDQADRLHALILDMLTLARIESDQQVFDIGTVRVEEVVDACLAAHLPVAEAKQLTLSADIADPTLEVMADRDGLREILDNLVDNAIKYTPEGGRVTVRGRKEDSLAAIEVEDTGIGIAVDHLDRVFERFYRVDRSRSREMGGTGLGLSIVKHIAQSLGGSVHVHSEKGTGSTVGVRLPLA